MNQKILGKELDYQQLHDILNNHINIISLFKNLIKITKKKSKVRTNNNSEVLNAISRMKNSIINFKLDVTNQINSLKTDVALIKSLPAIQKLN